jgi:hypothetical protein
MFSHIETAATGLLSRLSRHCHSQLEPEDCVLVHFPDRERIPVRVVRRPEVVD